MDIGPKRIFYRLRYEFFSRIDSMFPKLWIFFNRDILRQPVWNKNLSELDINKKNIFNKKNYLKSIKFSFLNETRELYLPFQKNLRSC